MIYVSENVPLPVGVEEPYESSNDNGALVLANNSPSGAGGSPAILDCHIEVAQMERRVWESGIV